MGGGEWSSVEIQLESDTNTAENGRLVKRGGLCCSMLPLLTLKKPTLDLHTGKLAINALWCGTGSRLYVLQSL